MDIAERADIELLVNTFYGKVQNDPLLAPFFAHVHWEGHLPVMYSFWENVLFHKDGYSGNPIVKHRLLHERMPLSQEHFDRWLQLFCDTVEALYEGRQAETIKQRALSIAWVMQSKL